MTVGRRRKTNKHLPARVYRKHGAYYFVDLDMKWQRLGESLGEAYHALAQFCPDDDPIKTMDDLADRYQREMLPSYSEKRQKDKAKHMERIRAALGHMPLDDITSGVIRAFRDKVGKRVGRNWNKPALANRTLGTLSHMFSTACEWDIMQVNPCQGVQRPPEPQRTRYVEDAEFWAVHAYCPPMQQIAMELAWLTGLRRADILMLTRDSVTDDGLMVHTSKTDRSLLFEWSDEMRELVQRALAIKPQVRRFVICNRQGKGYTPDGFSAIWRRARAKAIEKGKLGETYRFHDLRAKSASDDKDLQRASQRLGHTSIQTTDRHYNRTARVVQPLR